VSQVTERTENTPVSTPPTTRRALFAGVGAVGAVAVLAACAEDTTSTTTSAITGAPAAGATSGAAAAGGIAKTSDIPVGGGKIIAASGVVVTQPVAGTFKAFDSTCTHQRCPLASVSGGTINCDCHFSKFSIADGSVVSPPATEKLPEKKIVVDGDTIKLG